MHEASDLKTVLRGNSLPFDAEARLLRNDIFIIFNPAVRPLDNDAAGTVVLPQAECHGQFRLR
jgi:hypothetical protein